MPKKRTKQAKAIMKQTRKTDKVSLFEIMAAILIVGALRVREFYQKLLQVVRSESELFVHRLTDRLELDDFVVDYPDEVLETTE